MLRMSLLVLSLSLAFAPRTHAAPPVYDFTAVTSTMQQFVQTHGLEGASLHVNKDGIVAYTQTFGNYDTSTRIPIASASKWVSGLTIARLVDRGAMAWNDRVGDYFPQVSADKAEITLEQLMSHTSGLPHDDDSCLSSLQYTLAGCAEQILEQPLIGAPGTVFAYGGNSMQVAGRMAEIATSEAWDDLFIDEVVMPLNLTATDWAFFSTAPGYVRRANPRIAGGARSTLGDYATLVGMVLARGVSGGRRFLSTDTIDAMARDRTAGTSDLARPPTAPSSYGYGIGQWIEKVHDTRYLSGAPIVSSPGAFGFHPWVDPMSGIAGVLMVQDQGLEVIEDIRDVRALVGLVTIAPTLPCTQTHRGCQAPAPPKQVAPKLDAIGRRQ